jgi:hypothetical protein
MERHYAEQFDDVLDAMSVDHVTGHHEHTAVCSCGGDTHSLDVEYTHSGEYYLNRCADCGAPSTGMKPITGYRWWVCFCNLGDMYRVAQGFALTKCAARDAANAALYDLFPGTEHRALYSCQQSIPGSSNW